MRILRFQIFAAIAAAVVVVFLVLWAERTVQGFSDGKVGEKQFEYARTINGLLGVPLWFVLAVMSVLFGGFSISSGAGGGSPMWIILLGGTIWAVIVFLCLRIFARIWRWLVQMARRRRG